MGNNRGNKHSRSHITLDPNTDTKFWDYSFHEMGLYDIPAMINFIKKITGVEKVTYIGHSQGTSQMFAAMSLKPDYYKANLNGFIALGPVTFMKNIGATFMKTAADYNLDSIFEFLRINELLTSTATLEQIQLILCKNVGIVCTGLLNMLADSNINDDDMDRFLVFVGHFPSGSSSRSLKHFASNVRNGLFADPTGQAYPVTSIKDIPIGLFVGNDDKLATVADNRELKDILNSNGTLKFYKEYEDMGHSTFFLSKTNKYVEDLFVFLESHVGK
jgi:pimeloyl-ACP methyl ester carboxylesterase